MNGVVAHMSAEAGCLVSGLRDQGVGGGATGTEILWTRVQDQEV